MLLPFRHAMKIKKDIRTLLGFQQLWIQVIESLHMQKLFQRNKSQSLYYYLIKITFLYDPFYLLDLLLYPTPFYSPCTCPFLSLFYPFFFFSVTHLHMG